MKNKKVKIFAFICVFVGLALIATYVYLSKKSVKEVNIIDMTSENVNTQEKEPQKPTEKVIKNPIDFEELNKINKDIFAWIVVPGTSVNYPVLYSSDEYYLRRGYDKEYSYPGSIFVESEYNSRNFKDSVTLIYGHQMQDATMFSDLEMFASKPLNDKAVFTIYTKNEKLTYRIFAATQYSNKHVLYYNDFSNRKIFNSFFDKIFDARTFASNLDRSVDIRQGNIAILSTCYLENREQRFLVMGVCIKKVKLK